MQAINKLILGDNLEILRTLETETVDLIYLDPPFFSNRNYEVIWGDKGEVRSFEDRFSGGIDHYISWLKERVVEMYRILKPTGSIFLHCDWHADAYIRVEILDRIFGYQNFKSHIVWRRTTAHGNAKQGSKKFEQNFDSIFIYGKSSSSTFNTIYVPFSDDQIEQQYNKVDENGRNYRLVTPTAAKGGGDTSYEFYGVKPPQGRFWAYSKENMEKFKEDGKLYFSNTGQPYIKYYLDERPGVSVMAFWDDIKPMSPTSTERIGYPTQKPLLLLKRIIEAASNEGDLILDPFVGGGTTVAVADKLSRKWIGIDQSVQAIKVTEFRMNQQQDLFSKPFITQLHKYDYDTLRYKDAFEFETFIVQQFGGITNSKQRSDLGLDGKTRDNTPIQVKRSDNIGRNVIDNFLSAIQRFDSKLFDKNIAEQKPVGHIIAFSFGRGAVEEVARLKNQKNIIIKLEKVEDIIPIAKKPTIKVEILELDQAERRPDKKGVREIKFIAKGESVAGISLFSWDFNYQANNGFKPTIIIDKIGEQVHKFKAGLHNIAIKVVDNDGLDNIEIVKLKVNGTIERG
jgi:DNA modification methylase